MNNLSISTPAIRLEAVNQNIVALRAQLAELEALRDQIQAEIPAEPQSRTIYTRAQVDQILRDNDAAVEQAIIKLFQLQTAGEQMSAGTHCHNDAGFPVTIVGSIERRYGLPCSGSGTCEDT